MITHSSEIPPINQNRYKTADLLDCLKSDKDILKLFDAETRKWLAGMEYDDALGYIYGHLLEVGRDPDTCLVNLGILEEDIWLI